MRTETPKETACHRVSMCILKEMVSGNERRYNDVTMEMYDRIYQESFEERTPLMLLKRSLPNGNIQNYEYQI
jgi:hypothetical protein